jgi:hypothetical protein
LPFLQSVIVTTAQPYRAIHVGSFETFIDLRGNPNRAKIIGCDEADDTVAGGNER